MTKPSSARVGLGAGPKSVEARVGMQLISRAASVLRALEGQSAGLSLGQIANATHLPRPTVQRIVDALCVEHLVMVDPLHGGVRLGPMIARLATSVRIDLTVLARPYLEQLCWTTRETVAMTVLQDGKVVLIGLVPPPAQEIRLTSSLGSIWTLHSTAEGKVLLAGLPEATIRGLLVEPLARKTPNTVTDVEALLTELREVARAGFALDLEGTTQGISAIATSLVDAEGTRYAISILTPASRFQSHIERFRNELGRCRSQILAAAGLPG